MNEELPDWATIRKAWMRAAGPARGQREIMAELMDSWRQETSVLHEVSQPELAALAEFALAGPGVVLGRALHRFDRGACNQDRFSSLVDANWNGLRAFLNKGWFRDALTRRGQHYADAILEAVVDGNLESVLDEHLWITGQLDPRSLQTFAKDLRQVLGLHAGRQRVFESKDKEFTLRCHAALQFSDAQVEGSGTGKDERLRTDDLRRAFNTPFWPHTLITTSLGQEGLDFHVWCRQLLHWDLCPSPLELEQREGRIQRFGGLSVRSALATRLKSIALENSASGESPWSALASCAETENPTDTSGLSPWWVCEGEHVDRYFVELPQSRHVQRYAELQKQRWLYRLALGQPHQQDFIENVGRFTDGRDCFALNLSAFESKGQRELMSPG